jgi:hypothetical protein
MIHFQVAEIFQMPLEGANSADLSQIDLIEDFQTVLTFNNKGYLIDLVYYSKIFCAFPTIIFVAFCSFFLGSLTVVHRGRQLKSGGRQQKSGGRQQKSSRAGQQYCFP